MRSRVTELGGLWKLILLKVVVVLYLHALLFLLFLLLSLESDPFDLFLLAFLTGLLRAQTLLAGPHSTTPATLVATAGTVTLQIAS